MSVRDMILHKETLIIASMCLSGVTFGIGNIDSFPYHVFAIMLLGLTKFKNIDYLIIILVFLVISLTAIVDNTSYDFSLFRRQFLNYAAVIVGAAYLIAYKVSLARVSKVIYFVLITNIIIGFLQSYSDFFTIFSNARLDESGQRGKVGLFSEPTSFGLFCVCTFLFAVINLKNIENIDVKKLLWKIAFLSLFAILFVNKSSTAILILTIFALLSSIRSARGILFVLVIVAFLLYTYHFLPQSRLGIILNILTTKDIYYLLGVDGSINERLSSVIGPYYGVFANNLLPSSAFEYRLTYASLREATGGFFWWGGSDKIMNYLGTIIYELSIFGLILIFRYVFFSFKSKINYIFLITAVLFLSNSVPLLHGYPLLLFATYKKELKNGGNT